MKLIIIIIPRLQNKAKKTACKQNEFFLEFFNGLLYLQRDMAHFERAVEVFFLRTSFNIGKQKNSLGWA
jgi:hypothetical protein